MTCARIKMKSCDLRFCSQYPVFLLCDNFNGCCELVRWPDGAAKTGLGVLRLKSM